MIDLELTWTVLQSSTTVNVLESRVHGPKHWARVAANGRDIAALTEGCDPEVVDAFALFHDAMRQNDWSDPHHGERGAELAQRVLSNYLTREQMQKLVYACQAHDMGLTSDDSTVGACWDADRLDLPRVGVRPQPAYFSTDAGLAILERRTIRPAASSWS